MHTMNIQNFDLNLLLVFDAMMTERNVTRAAERVFLSQPAASHALARLRTQIGDPLFVRSGRDMIPTAKAAALEPVVRDMLERLRAVLGEAQFDPRTSDATFRIGLVDLAEYVIAPMFARLMRDEAPHIRFSIHGLDETNFQAQLASGVLDIALSSTLGPFAAGIHSRKLAAQSLVGLVRKGHPLARKRATAREFRQVKRLAIDVRAGRGEGLADRSLPAAEISGDVVYATPHFLAVPTLLANSDLMLITSAIAARLLCAQHPLAEVGLPIRLPPNELRLIWHERTHREPSQQWLREKFWDRACAVSKDFMPGLARPRPPRRPA
jgi:DNA-binding transcriptional LysR family regulator